MLMCVCHADNCRHRCALERVGVVAQNFGECVRGGLLPTLACVWCTCESAGTRDVLCMPYFTGRCGAHYGTRASTRERVRVR